MSAAAEFATEIKELGDKIVALTVLQANQLKTYLEDVHGIKAAAGGGGMMMAAAPAAAEKAPEKNRIRRPARKFRRQQDRSHQGRSFSDRPWPQGSQRLGRGRSQGG